MKKTILILMILFSTFKLYSQSNYQDVVYLKDGSIYRGIILEQIPNEWIKLEIFGKNIIVFQVKDIAKIIREPIASDELSDSKQNAGLPSGYNGVIELGYDIGASRIRLNVINGYRVNPHFAIGFGTGLRYFYNGGGLYIPLFLDLRANILNGTVSPYFALGVGYSMWVTNNFGGGFMLNPTIGASFKISSKLSMNVGFGYDLLSFNGFNSSAWPFNIGISF